MGNHISCDADIALGWDASTGEDWSYKAKRGFIKQIIVTHGYCINSIKFKDDSPDWSRTFGRDGGTRTDKVDLDSPSEFLTGISGDLGLNVVHSLKLYTNRAEYGPFGTESGIPFSFRTEGMVTGFHGQESVYLAAIGVYLKPACLYWTRTLMEQHSEIDQRRIFGLLPRSPGPWGSINGGREWDDGVFSAVKRIQVHVRRIGGVDVITAVRFGYQKRDGPDFWSKIHGTDNPGELQELEVDGVTKFLTGVEGFYGPPEGNGDVEVIRSVTFHTNKGSWGPFGCEIGKYFSSMNTIDGKKGKVVGFHGRSGAYLNAIGVHTEYYILKNG